jgi:hypothetical protein
MSVRNQPKIHEANRRPKGRHPLFCFISFICIYYPLTDIVIVHIVYINETNPLTLLSVRVTCERQSVFKVLDFIELALQTQKTPPSKSLRQKLKAFKYYYVLITIFKKENYLVTIPVSTSIVSWSL